ncbi:hypothetical protein JTE90_025336 [Oedothorax gibbosus]|uniref:Uncharacterized protein n=1 Tax=Oedothorax gibbosus TaxID=931172 RepID=A0AAV6V613_9ARAC|nr:hypothetical protein JTE90_025336 [Oedothorax gibbosus]
MAKRTAGTVRCSMQIGRLSTRLTVGRMVRSSQSQEDGDASPPSSKLYDVLGWKWRLSEVWCESRGGGKKANAGSVIYVIHQLADMFQKRSLVPGHNGSSGKGFLGSMGAKSWPDGTKISEKSFQVSTKSSKSVLRVQSPT